jgi:hypothetical protein
VIIIKPFHKQIWVQQCLEHLVNLLIVYHCLPFCCSTGLSPWVTGIDLKIKSEKFQKIFYRCLIYLMSSHFRPMLACLTICSNWPFSSGKICDGVRKVPRSCTARMSSYDSHLCVRRKRASEAISNNWHFARVSSELSWCCLCRLGLSLPKQLLNSSSVMNDLITDSNALPM